MASSKKINKKKRLCCGMRKSIHATAKAWGGPHVANHDANVVLLFDSEQYSNIPNINITDENAVQLSQQIIDSCAQTVMNDVMFGGLSLQSATIKSSPYDGRPELFLQFHNKSSPEKTPISWCIRLGLDKLLDLQRQCQNYISKFSTDNLFELRDSIDKIIADRAEQFSNRL